MTQSQYYQSLGRGIAQYGSRFRAIVFVQGTQVQRYFGSLNEAITWRDAMLESELGDGVKGVTRSVKRRNAKHSDLPIGITQVRNRRRLSSGQISETDVIKTFVYQNARPVKSFSVTFGKTRTREQAIAEVIRRRELWYQQQE